MAVAALLIAGCTSDDLVDSIHPTAADSESGKGGGKFAALMRVAGSTAAAGDLATAAGLYRRAHEMSPRRVEPLVALGRTLAALGAHDLAAESFRSAISISRTLTGGSNVVPEAAHGLGNALIEMSQPKTALTQFEAALMEREDPRTYSGMGVAYDMLGQHGAAQAYYRTGLELEPNNVNLLNNLGLSLSVIGRYNEAIEVFRKAVVSPGATSRHKLNMALAYGLAGRTAEAADLAREFLDEDSVRKNLAYYETLKAIKDTGSRLRAIGTHTNSLNVDPDRQDLRKKKRYRAKRNKG